MRPYILVVLQRFRPISRADSLICGCARVYPYKSGAWKGAVIRLGTGWIGGGAQSEPELYGLRCRRECLCRWRSKSIFAVRRFPVGQVKAVLYVYHLIQLKKVYVNIVLFVRKGRSIQHKGVTVDHLICGYNGRAPACADDFCPALNINLFFARGRVNIWPRVWFLRPETIPVYFLG